MTTIPTLESNLEIILVPSHFQAIIPEVYFTEANRPNGIKPTDLSELCIISETLAEGIVKSNTQLMRNKYDNILSINFTTNDRMLGYRIIQSNLFYDTMFATPKSKSTIGNTFCQLFVPDKVFV